MAATISKTAVTGITELNCRPKYPREFTLIPVSR